MSGIPMPDTAGWPETGDWIAQKSKVRQKSAVLKKDRRWLSIIIAKEEKKEINTVFLKLL